MTRDFVLSSAAIDMTLYGGIYIDYRDYYTNSCGTNSRALPTPSPAHAAQDYVPVESGTLRYTVTDMERRGFNSTMATAMSTFFCVYLYKDHKDYTANSCGLK